MEKIVIGKYVNTHGIKGEIRIKSDFKYKNKVFVVGNIIYIKDNKYIINSYRIHKDYDMITLKGINDINDIIFLKGSLVYFDYSNLNLTSDEYLDEDLIGLKVYTDEFKGIVTGIINLTKNKKLLCIDNKYIPFELIENINFKDKIIKITKVDGLL